MMHKNEQTRWAAFKMACTTLPDGILFTDALTCTLYASDASMYQIQPLAVLIPKTQEQVQFAIRAAIQTGIPIIGRGSGTSLAGQAIGQGLVIDFSKYLNRILHFDLEKRQITVEPGVILDDLNRFLAPHGLLFGPDPASASRATLGGMTATNATGTHSTAYGSMVDHLVSAKLILHDGQVVLLQELTPRQLQIKQKQEDEEGKLYQKVCRILQEKEHIIRRNTPKHWRRQGGYRVERLLDEPFNLAKLLCGAEGTLGIVMEITLALVKKPRFTAMAIAHFNDRMAALRATPALLTTNPYAIELLDHHALDRCREVPDYAPRLTFVEGNPLALLMTEVIGETSEACAKKLSQVVEISQKQLGCIAVTLAQSAAELSNVCEVRKAGLGLVMGVRGALKPLPFIEDAAVPVEHLADYITELEAVLAETQTQATMYGHASAGCLHVRPYVNPHSELGLTRMKRLAMASAEFAKRYGGVISSEHGDGLVRGWLAASFFGTELYEVYQEVKQAFDPQNLFNPSKKTNSPPFTESLRTTSIKKNAHMPLDFSEEGGFEAATELCNGAGVCRKLQIGTMCPSFRATRDELHSTRGRANMLRAALSGSLALDGPEVKAAMDLCISCKACKAECPSSVDMAKLKLAWLNIYFRTHKAPLRDRMMAALPRIAPLLSGKPLGCGLGHLHHRPSDRTVVEW
ncbi:MAG TPA: FAD-binding and (Fe-S)-binding domain-containing protein [Rhodothermales bacterium]|nr:FAD-binding and (Fe-S)-binding domain-containing protein [Rhodothermales bacterium]